MASARYDIAAKAEGNPDRETMSGSMLQSLLEDRFQLKIHRETRVGPVYALTVAESGFKLKERTTPCAPPPQFDKANPPTKQAKLAMMRDTCGMRMATTGPNRLLELNGSTVAQFAKNMEINYLDLPLIDRTGIPGMFDFHLEFAGDELVANPNGDPRPPAGPSLFTAIEEQLGLKLERTRGPSDVLVVDRLDRPSEN
jgi:uncharacterized protein (TIGR03435 family)